MSQERTEGRRASDKERTHLRKLEQIIRTFLAHYDEHPEHRFWKHTVTMAQDAKPLLSELDKVRAGRSTSETEKTPEDRALGA